MLTARYTAIKQTSAARSGRRLGRSRALVNAPRLICWKNADGNAWPKRRPNRPSEEIGVSQPENCDAGRLVIIPAAKIAAICVRRKVESRSPKLVAAVTYRAAPTKRKALADSEWQGFGKLIEIGRQAKLGGELIYPSADCFRWQMKQAGVQRQVLPHRQLAIERERLRHVAYAISGLKVVRLRGTTKQAGFALGDRQESRQHLHGGGLAAAVGAKKAENFPSLDMKS